MKLTRPKTVRDIADAVDSLQAADKLRFAAALLDENRYDLAKVVAQRAIDNITFAQMAGK